MPYIQKVKKVSFGVTVTPEAKALVKRRAKSAGLSQSEYLENMIRRGESEIYDDVVNSLLQYHQIITSQTDLCNSLVDEINSLLEENTRLKDSIKQLLKDIGISPNQIPD